MTPASLAARIERALRNRPRARRETTATERSARIASIVAGDAQSKHTARIRVLLDIARQRRDIASSDIA